MRNLQMTQQTTAMISENSDQQQQQSSAGNSSSGSSIPSFLEQMGTNETLSRGINDDFRFQYVLAAATSIATKSNEETLTYLNQGQSYEIKLKKLGDLSNCRGKLMRSVVKICFHERRLQYMEREQLQIWQSSRPGEKILDIDIPLSYGLIHVNQSTAINTAEILWDPMKEVGVYIKVSELNRIKRAVILILYNMSSFHRWIAYRQNSHRRSTAERKVSHFAFKLKHT